jgi:hypothetical protein
MVIMHLQQAKWILQLSLTVLDCNMSSQSSYTIRTGQLPFVGNQLTKSGTDLEHSQSDLIFSLMYSISEIHIFKVKMEMPWGCYNISPMPCENISAAHCSFRES